MNTKYELVVPDGFFDESNIPLVIEIFIVLLNMGYEEQSLRDILTAGCLAAPHLRVYQ